MALAYFITFSTYGTWLHSCAKGSADDEHCGFGEPFLEEDSHLEQQAREKMVQAPYVMSAAEREIVCRAMVTLAADRGWQVLAAHLRSNHVHIVLHAEGDPGRIMSDLKARASRDLTRAGYGSTNRRRWTRHGSTRHLFSEEQIAEKIRYTLDGQGERMACYEQEPRTK